MDSGRRRIHAYNIFLSIVGATMVGLLHVPFTIPYVRARALSTAYYKLSSNAMVTNSATTPQFLSADWRMEYSDDTAKMRSEFLQLLLSRRTAEGHLRNLSHFTVCASVLSVSSIFPIIGEIMHVLTIIQCPC